MKYLYTFLFFLVGICHLSAQMQIDVNRLTGTANTTLPLFNIHKGGLLLPVSVSYAATGIKPEDVEGTAGIGWNLQVGGEITRNLRGLPDDALTDSAGNSRLGWLNLTNTAPGAITGFISNDNNSGTCTDETNDINYIGSHFNVTLDSEPDIFNVDAPGLSFQFVFDKDRNIRPLSYQDVKITYKRNVAGRLTSFTIVNDQGVSYVFDVTELMSRWATPSTGTEPTYFKSTYDQYRNFINYFSSWKLSSITDPNGNAITLSYQQLVDVSPIPNAIGHFRSLTLQKDEISLYLGGATTPTSQYFLMSRKILMRLVSITTGNDIALFSWNQGTGDVIKNFISNIQENGRTYNFNYSGVSYTNPTTSAVSSRFFLRGISEDGCGSPTNFTFTYFGESSSGGSYQTLLSDLPTTDLDYWGYYAPTTGNTLGLMPGIYVNPSDPTAQRYVVKNNNGGTAPYTYVIGNTTGSNPRTPQASTIINGSLSTITDGFGGLTSFVYEPNSYWGISGNNVLANGIRIKQITKGDGVGSTNNIVSNYTYVDPANTGHSSGVPLSLPVFAFTIPYTGSNTGIDLWKSSTALSQYDLSDEDHSILYQYVKESTTGAGSTLYQYYVPATYWSTSAVPACGNCTVADWGPTINYIARPSCTSFGQLRNDTYSYPFAPNPNYNMERGFVQKITNYNEAATTVGETSFIYQRTGNPFIVSGFRSDINGGATAYAKYDILTNVTELVQTTTKKTYGAPTTSAAVVNTANFTYNATFHKLIKQELTNSDNSVSSQNFKYTKDYTITATGTDSTANAIYHLQKLNINTPVETYTQVQRAGTTKTVGAQLIKFKTFAFSGGTYRYLPLQTLKLNVPDGVIFSPFTITSGVASQPDPNYTVIGNFSTYDDTGLLQTSDDGFKHVNTVIVDHSSEQPVAAFKYAAIGEIGFEDFDSNIRGGGNYTLSTSTGIGNTNSHTGNSYSFLPGQTISKTIARKTGEVNYILSAWISSSVAGTITINLNNGALSIAKAYTATGSNAQYFEWVIPVSSMPTSFTMALSTLQSIYIDDVLFYPKSAEVSTSAFAPITHYKIAETNTNGVSSYFTNDAWGRVLYTYDRDKNIRSKTTYTTYATITQGLSIPTIHYGNTVQSSPTAFTAANGSCLTGIFYSWDFGDGTPVVSGIGLQSVSHTYSTTGTKTVTVTSSLAGYTTQSATAQVTITSPPPPPLTATICASGVTAWDQCTHKKFTGTTCGSNPTSNTSTYYTVDSVTGAQGTLSYQWQKSTDNGVTWQNTATNTNQINIACTINITSYKIRCVVSSTTGQSGTSNILGLTVDCF